jgi:TatD DNase family protein
MWIDSHCHITADAFREDLGQVLARAAEAGVETVIAVGAGYGIEQNQRAVELAARDPRVFATVGVHPHDAAQLEGEGRERLREWLGRPRVVAVGECGLDYFYTHSPREIQREVSPSSGARRRGSPGRSTSATGEDAYRDLLAI